MDIPFTKLRIFHVLLFCQHTSATFVLDAVCRSPMSFVRLAYSQIRLTIWPKP